MQIVAFDEDTLSETRGTAKISWLMRDLLTSHKMNETNTNADGWPATEMRSWLRDTILPTIDSSIRSHIVDVDKTYYDYTDKTTETISDNIWLASAREIFGGTSYESSGPDYTVLFTDQTSRIKKRSGEADLWWLRSANSSYSYSFRYINGRGDVNSSGASTAYTVCVGFCTGKTLIVEEEISDTWDQIIANIDNGTYNTKYKIGNYKPLDLGTTYGTVNMQIVAMDADKLANGGTAPLTFMSMNLLKESQPMHRISDDNVKFEDTNLYSFLNTTVFGLIPSNISSRIRIVNKISGMTWNISYNSDLKIWIPSVHELGLENTGTGGNAETSGVQYAKIYSSQESRQKIFTDNTFRYWTRSHANSKNYRYWTSILNTGNIYANGYSPDTTSGVCIGFCLGLETD